MLLSSVQRKREVSRSKWHVSSITAMMAVCWGASKRMPSLRRWRAVPLGGAAVRGARQCMPLELVRISRYSVAAASSLSLTTSVISASVHTCQDPHRHDSPDADAGAADGTPAAKHAMAG